MIRLWRFPWSTNVERVALALAHKGLEVESVAVDPADRSAVRAVSGQDLVPVIEDEGTVVSDSTRILLYLEDRYPERPLLPSATSRRAEMLVFLDWFDRVWKGPPNEIEAELRRPEPDAGRIDALAGEMRRSLDLFEAMLAGRDHLMGDFSAADCSAFPFLRYAVLHDEGDDELFHQVLRDHLPLGEDHWRLDAWIHRVEARPRA